MRLKRDRIIPQGDKKSKKVLDLGFMIWYSIEVAEMRHAQIAQSVEQRTENPRVAGSIPALGITVN